MALEWVIVPDKLKPSRGKDPHRKDGEPTGIKTPEPRNGPRKFQDPRQGEPGDLCNRSLAVSVGDGRPPPHDSFLGSEIILVEQKAGKSLLNLPRQPSYASS